MLHDLTASTVGRLLLAAILGGVIGLERELNRKPAGIRTNLLICLGAALFTVVSWEMAGSYTGDHTRIAAQIITGIGFIGAGVVIRERGTIIGITSAATIFVVAAIGMAAGSGLVGIGIFTTLLVLASLVVIGHLEVRLGLHAELMNFRVTAPAASGDIVEKVRGIIDDLGLQTRRWSTRPTGDGMLVEFESEVTLPQQRDLITRLGALKVRSEARPVRVITSL
jgi:putative Mg2+ transporter-C (MgtC) family protein